MRRLLPVALALCCLLSAGAVAAPLSGPAAERSPAVSPTAGVAAADTARAVDAQAAGCPDAPGIVCVPNTTNYLAPDQASVVVASANDSSLDVSTALSTDAARTTERLRAGTLRAAFESAETNAERRAVVERFAGRLDNRSTVLRERQREALTAYNEGELSDDAFLRTLVRLDASGDRLERTVGELARYRDRTGADVSDAQLGELYTDLIALDGPVRDRLKAVYDGTQPSTRVFIETSDQGIVLAAIVDRRGQETFVREAHLLDARAPGSADEYGGNPTRVVDRASELYPWTFDNRGPTQINLKTRPFGTVGTYRIVKYHPQGRLTTFLDGSSHRVFSEYQYKEIDRIPTTTAAKTNESAGMTLTLRRTHEGGPFNVTVTDAETDRPVDATVRVNDWRLGTTGDDGSVRAVTPRSVIVTVVAEYEGRTVTISRTTDDRRALVGPNS